MTIQWPFKIWWCWKNRFKTSAWSYSPMWPCDQNHVICRNGTSNLEDEAFKGLCEWDASLENGAKRPLKKGLLLAMLLGQDGLAKGSRGTVSLCHTAPPPTTHTCAAKQSCDILLNNHFAEQTRFWSQLWLWVQDHLYIKFILAFNGRFEGYMVPPQTFLASSTGFRRKIVFHSGGGEGDGSCAT